MIIENNDREHKLVSALRGSQDILLTLIESPKKLLNKTGLQATDINRQLRRIEEVLKGTQNV